MFAQVEMVEPSAWLPGLNKLLYAVKTQRARDVLSLCIHMTGDINAGLVLSRLLYWMPKGCREDGVIWKADREWQDELLLSYEQMNRVRELLNPFVDWWKEQAMGAPTYHYSLKVEALVKGIAGVIKRTVAFVKGFLFEKVENRFSENSKNDFRESPESITNKTPKSTSIQNIVGADPLEEKAEKILELPRDVEARLIEAGIRSGVAKEFAGLTVAVVQGVIDDALLKQQAGKLRKTRQAYIVGTLRGMMAAPVEPKQDDLAGYAWGMQPSPLPQPLPEFREGGNEPAGEDIAGDVVEESRDGQIFHTAMVQLELQLGDAFQRWLKGAVLVAAQAGEMVIGVRSSFAVQACEGKLARSIKRIFGDVVGAPVALRFEVV